jgi:UDP-glucose 4-epimerase
VLKQTPCTIYGDGEQTRDYIYVEDVARANIAALQQGDGSYFNIGTGIHTTLNQLIHQLQQITGHATKTVYQAERSGDIKHSYFTIDKAVHELNWSPKFQLADGLSKTFRYYLEQHSTKIL